MLDPENDRNEIDKAAKLADKLPLEQQDEVSVDFVKAEMGWNLLGSYYFSQGKAKVEITDKTNGNLVVADAVKWVKD